MVLTSMAYLTARIFVTLHGFLTYYRICDIAFGSTLVRVLKNKCIKNLIKYFIFFSRSTWGPFNDKDELNQL